MPHKVLTKCGHPKIREGMYYVYIISLSNGQYYIGKTADLRKRIKEHTNGEERTTRRFLPCRLVTYVAFSKKILADKFERYLKTGSGFVFRNKHLV